MDKAGFNTLEAAEILAKAGLEARQAKAVVQVAAKALSEGVATTGDVDKLAGRIDRVETDLKAEIGKVETELKSEIGKVETELKSEIGKVETELKSEIGKVESLVKEKSSETNAKISETKKNLAYWMAGGFTMLAGLVVAVAAFLKMGN